MYTEEELLPISALQHLAFCPRQWGLIYLENIWSENVLTVEGGHLHEKVHEGAVESRVDVKIARGLRLRSLRLGLVGIADLVEFHKLIETNPGDPDTEQKGRGIHLAGDDWLWLPIPVEYKRGKPKSDHCDKIQLCAQALCLEEMLNVRILKGQIYYGQPRRRQDVEFDQLLREETEQLCRQLHELTKLHITPIAEYQKKCKSCSIVDYCLPKAISKKNAKRYLVNIIADSAEKRETI